MNRLLLIGLLSIAPFGGGDASAATLQLIHNAPGPDVALLDIVVYSISGDSLHTFEDISFRGATDTHTFASGVYLLAVRNPDDPEENLVVDNRPVLDHTVLMIARNADGGGLQILFARFLDEPTSDQVAIKGWNGLLDADPIDILDSQGTFSFEDLSYGEASLSDAFLPPAAYDVSVRHTGSGESLGFYHLPLAGLEGSFAVLFLSGYVQGSPQAGLLLARDDGTVIDVQAVPVQAASWGDVKDRYR